MISFEWYVARAKIDLEVFFESQKITSDEELRNYCILKKMIPPTTSYFSVKEPELPKPKPVTKTTRKKPVKKAPAPKPVKKPAKKPRTTRKRNTRTSKK